MPNKSYYVLLLFTIIEWQDIENFDPLPTFSDLVEGIFGANVLLFTCPEDAYILLCVVREM